MADERMSYSEQALAKALEMVERGEAGANDVFAVDCLHDCWCPVERNGICDCTPWVTVRVVTGSPEAQA